MNRRAAPPPRHRRDPRAAVRPWWATAASTLALLCVAGAAFALWHSSANWSGGTIRAGDLRVTVTTLTWECPEQGESGDGESLPGLLLAPGQTLILRQAIETVTIGDDLNAALSVGFPSLPAGITGNWHLESGGAQVAPASGNVVLDELLVLPNLKVTSWVAVVRLTLPAGDLVWVDPTDPNLAIKPLDLGKMTVTAQQVRCGDGFTVPCPSAMLVADE